MQLIAHTIETPRLSFSCLWNGVSEGMPVIALHGWLDNAASFKPLSEFMELELPFYAIDLAGHGLSEHRSADASYQLFENVVDLGAIISQVAGVDQQVVLVGHSMGGIICSLYAASCPERVAGTVLLDSLGPITDEAVSVLPQLQKAMNRITQFKSSRLVVYPSKALAARVRTGGIGKIGIDAAKILVDRGLKEVEEGFVWASDPRLLEPSMVRLSEAQVEAIFQGIVSPVMLICGSEGFFSDRKALEKRLAYIHTLERHTVAGGHHFHMEGDVERSAKLIGSFLDKISSATNMA